MAKLAFTDTLPMKGTKATVPMLGYGVGGSPRAICPTSCVNALKIGYRHIDTAQAYGNEAEVGQGVKQSDVPREDIFITTKILKPGETADETYDSCVESIKKLDDRDGGYVDLFLIHNSNIGPAQRKTVWGVLERLQSEGKIKSIGVSNYSPAHLEEMKQYAKIWPPAVNQIELHPWAQQGTVTEYCKKNGIVVEAYCPIVRNRRANDPTVLSIANKLGVTPNQILLRYCLQKGIVPLTKSDNVERMKTNADLYNFEISDADMDTLNGLDQGIEGSICPHNWPLNTA